MTDANKAADTPAVPPQPGTPEYDAKMVALAESRMGLTPEPQPAKPVKPAEVPDKFWNAEKGEVDYAAMAKSYRELESKLGAPKPAAPAAPAPQAPAKAPTLDEQKAFLTSKGVTAEDLAKLDEAGVKAKYAELNPAPAVDPAKAAAEAKGVDFNALQAEYNEKGALSPETYAALEAKGFPKDVVDTYIAGKQAASAAYDKAAFDAAGGEKEYAAMVEWAGNNLSPAEIAAFNEAVVSGDKNRMALAVSGVRGRYVAAEGEKATLKLSGGNGTTTGAQGFSSRKEQSAAINDPRYKSDPVYRKGVEARIAASTF